MTDLLQRVQAGLADRYRIDRRLGEGGMAVVFGGVDLKHDRAVAVKVLRPELAAMVGAERFLREIQVTAQLQHPHILPLYDSGAAGDLLYYVMPLVTGETLRDRLVRERQLPVEEVAALVQSVAGALDYAHRYGVLHRDIKPENILLHDRQPMLADFGIAVAVRAAGGARLTQTGVSIGTPSYMSPEQMSADRELDGRSDLYALACVAYEALVGEPPFTGPTLQAVVAAVMTEEPRPLLERRPSVPEGMADAIHRALERLPSDRFATVSEFSTALAAAAITGPHARRGPRLPPRRVRGPLALGAVAGLAAGTLLGFAIARRGAPADGEPVRRWSLVLPDSFAVGLAAPGSASARQTGQTAVAVSPNGDRLAYVAAQGNTTRLVLRPLDGDTVTVLPGTEGAYSPFFSPDGAWIGFFAGDLLRKVSVGGGDPITLAQVQRITGAVWDDDGRIVVPELDGFSLRLISESGTAADSTITLGTQFGTPDVLPGDEWLVGQLSSGQLALLSLATGTQLAITRRGVLPLDSVRQSDLLFGASPRWLANDHLVYAGGDGVLMAMPFDGASRRVLGEPFPLLTGVRMEGGFGYGAFSVSASGTLVYVPGRNQLYANIALATPEGRIDTLPVPRGPYTQPRLSPDGRRLAVQVRNPIGGWEVQLIDVATGVREKVEVAGNFRAFPASWLPSGRELMIGIWDPVQFLNYGARVRSLETGQERDIHLMGASYMTVAPDGDTFVFSDWRTGDLYLRGLGDDTTRTRIPARGFTGSFSPDGRWVSWSGVDGGVAVSPVPPTGAIHRVAERGQMPLWSPRGDALLYRDGHRYLRAPISTSGGFRVGPARVVAEGPFLSTFAWNSDIAPDGRLVVLLTSPQQSAATLGVITGFPGAVERLSPARNARR